MNSLLSLRSGSRSSSPAPDHSASDASEHKPRPLSRIHGLAAFRRGSPSPAPAPAAPTVPATLVQDGNFIEALTLKLAEGASRALTHPTTPPPASSEPALLKGKYPIPPGRGRAFGALITSELRAAQDNLHLYRAIQRLVHRPLSALLSTLTTNLHTLINSTGFLPPSVTAPPTSTLLHALGYSTFAAEILESFDANNLGTSTASSGPAFEGLKNLREGFENVVTMVVQPLTAAIKAEVAPLVEAFDTSSLVPHKVKPSTGPVSVKSISKGQAGQLAQLMPYVARALTRYTTPQSAPARAALATLYISLTWRALVALAYRPMPTIVAAQTHSRIPTPPATPPMFKKNLTPPATPPGGRFSIRLPITKEPSLTSLNRRPSATLALPRPPSPPAEVKPPLVVLAHDGRLLLEMFMSLPRPDVGTLAREAVDEALAALEQFNEFLLSLATNMGLWPPQPVPDMLKLPLKNIIGEDVPTLVALPVLLHTLASVGDVPLTVPSLLGLGDVQYRTACLTGFGQAEECEPFVARAVCKALGKTGGHPDCREKDEILAWMSGKMADLE